MQITGSKCSAELWDAPSLPRTNNMFDSETHAPHNDRALREGRDLVSSLGKHREQRNTKKFSDVCRMEDGVYNGNHWVEVAEKQFSVRHEKTLSDHVCGRQKMAAQR